MEELYISEVIKDYPKSATSPLLCKLSNGKQAVVKIHNNSECDKVLVNEFIAYKIAELFCLPIPYAGIATLDSRCNQNIYTKTNNYGHCFYSTYIEKNAPLNQNIIKLISNYEDFTKMILFDHIIYNKDRHPGNLIISFTKNPKFYMIDHTHVFKNQTIWDGICLRQGMQGNDYQDKDILMSNGIVYEMLFSSGIINREIFFKASENFMGILTQEKLKDIYAQIPYEWKYFELIDYDYDCLTEYILYRLYHLKDICSIICNERGYA